MNFDKIFFNIEDYTLIPGHIGEGAYGKVYKVKNNQNGQIYAAKIIKVDDNYDGKNQILFMREAKNLSVLNYPSIIKFYGINFRSFPEINESDYISIQPTIITELLTNGSLKDVLDLEKKGLARNDWNATKKYICLIGIADAMRYLHKHDILHRDLKPQNILLDDNLQPVICDFGLSKCFDESISKSRNMTFNVGTPLYMAPELNGIENEEYGGEIDVYSFSLLAYELVTGEEPYKDLLAKYKKNIFKFYNQILNGERPNFKNDVPEGMKNLLERCWNENPSERPGFEEIYETLISDYDLFPEDVDKDEVDNYLDYLREFQEKRVKIKEEDVPDQPENEFEIRNKELEDQLNEANEKIQTLEQQNIEKDEKLNLLESKNEELNEQNHLLEQQNVEKDDKLNNVEHKNEELNAQIHLLEQQNVEKDDKLINAEHKNEELNAQIHLLEQQNVEKNERINDLEQKNNEINEKIQFHERKCTESDAKLMEFEKINQELEGKLKDANSKIQLIEPISLENEERLKEYENKNKELEEKLKVANSEIQSFVPEKQGNVFIAEIVEINNKNEELEEKLKIANAKIRSIEPKNLKNEYKLNESMKRNQELEAQLKDAGLRIQLLEQQNKEIASDAERQIQFLIQQCNEKDEKLKEAEKKIQDFIREIQELQHRNQLLVEKCIEIENKLKAVEKKNAEIVKALEELHNKNLSLEKKYTETENKLKAIRDIFIFLFLMQFQKKKYFI